MPVRPHHPRSRFVRILRAITLPQYRYYNGKIIHAVRVGLAMLTSILVTNCIHMPLPSKVWASMTTMIVIGGLQHHGSIRRKAFERGLGTLLGALIGMTLLAIHEVSGSNPLIYALMSIVAGVCGYYAIGRAGYIALLTAITMCIVAGHGNNELVTGLWRTGSISIGIVIALTFSFALPLHATYSWRYGLADNLRACARLYLRVAKGEHIDRNTFVRQFTLLAGRSVQLRNLMPSVEREIGIPVAKLEQIQLLHRSLLSSLEILSEGISQAGQDAMRQIFARHGEADGGAVRTMLLSLARTLRVGGNLRALTENGNGAMLANHEADDAFRDNMVAVESAGPYWLAQRLAGQVMQLHELLREAEPYWNLEGKHSGSVYPGAQAM